MSKATQPTTVEAPATGTNAATAEFLKKLGVSEAALSAPPTIDQISPESHQGPQFSGPIDPAMQYMRATATRPREVQGLLRKDWRIVPEGIRLEGVHVGDGNDVYLARRREVGAHHERQDKIRRDSLRQRRAREPMSSGGGVLAADRRSENRGLEAVQREEF